MNNKWLNLVFMSILFLILGFPFINSVFGLLPELRVIEGPAAVKDRVLFTFRQLANKGNVYYNPRYQLIRLNSLIKVFGFGSASKNNYFIGRRQWLFYLGGENPGKTADGFRGVSYFTPDELEHIFRPIADRHEKLAARGIRYYFVIVPLKFNTYPEYLPAGLELVNSQTKVDQFIQYAYAQDVHFLIDTRPAVIAAKTERPVFYPYDSHWNDWGALVGTQTILRRIQDDLPSLPVPDLKNYRMATVRTKATSDIAAAVFIDDWYQDEEVKITPKNGYRAIQLRPGKDDAPTRTPVNLITTVDDPTLPTAILFGNSFMIRFRANFLAEAFNQVYFINNDYNQMELDYELMDLVQPEVVIQQVNEQYFFNY